MRVSSYRKVRFTVAIIHNYLKEIGFRVDVSEEFQSMNLVVATK
ncbi:MAG: hypothetical protein ACO1NV_11705 [Leptospira bouyouniensis]